MKIKHVEIMGFRSFRNLVRIEFPTGPGLVHLRGKNLDNTRLGGNACGKTSLWEAIMWCLFGRTGAGLRGPDVATWNGGQGVYVLVAINGHNVLRTWGTNKLTIDTDDATQEQVDQLVGLTYDAFLHAHYHAQHEPSFLDLGASDKVDLLSQVLDLEKWTQRARRTVLRLNEEDKVLKQLTERLSVVKGALSVLENDDLDKEADAWERDRRARRRQIASALNDLEARQASIPRVPESALLRLISLETELIAANDSDRANLRRDEKLLAEVNADIKRAEATAKMDECPTCGQHIRSDRRDECRRKVRFDQEALDRLHKDCNEWERRIDKRGQQIDAVRKSIAESKANERADKDKRASIRDAIESSKLQLEAIDRLTNPFERKMAEIKQRRKAMQARGKRLEASVVYYERHVEMLDAWVKHFKDIRLFLITEALTQLEIETNAELVNLGLTGWSITFAPDSETKSGTVKRGFSTMVQSPDNPRPVPWKVWSGGEAQRLRLASAMGLSDLITDYTGAPAFVEAWDEPSSGINVEGIDDMVKAFKERALRKGKQVWLIDHRALSSGDFDVVFTAVKQNGSTEVVQS